jgi:hypothetical protein
VKGTLGPSIVFGSNNPVRSGGVELMVLRLLVFAVSQHISRSSFIDKPIRHTVHGTARIFESRYWEIPEMRNGDGFKMSQIGFW